MHVVEATEVIEHAVLEDALTHTLQAQLVALNVLHNAAKSVENRSDAGPVNVLILRGLRLRLSQSRRLSRSKDVTVLLTKNNLGAGARNFSAITQKLELIQLLDVVMLLDEHVDVSLERANELVVVVVLRLDSDTAEAVVSTTVEIVDLGLADLLFEHVPLVFLLGGVLEVADRLEDASSVQFVTPELVVVVAAGASKSSEINLTLEHQLAQLDVGVDGDLVRITTAHICFFYLRKLNYKEKILQVGHDRARATYPRL